ncbi:MAG: 16S rRNA (adenine(1518)-N(6)/adenine(1519)-N(6))-dimethyltransferase RsmA [Hyphomicrobiales bacterium]|nr:16S rRNA (adenine(1518)-N(6)/adenine(1519)-N(6))-dimethyltransferase RsmA [Hyphomicrobiales bacterium]MCP5373859.1 16S rRNA (adenine(1518)-N(6)/adenine(1519)-N(6))-dimethyltransferase RsmA [Hyphomicrobiales bacterium]
MTGAGPDLPPLRDVIARHGLDARKSLGQHFLLDGNLTARIARAAGDLAGVSVIEVGPGPGGLTRALLAAGADRVVAVEKDDRCLAALAELAAAYPGRLDVVPGDALQVDAAVLVPAPRKVVANLPYNVATPLLLGWLRRATDFAGLTLMFQAEVADRLLAEPGTKARGRLSVITQWLCQVRRDFNVDKRAFTPPPKVMSTVVTLIPRPQPLAPAPWGALEKVTAAAFGQRRKMLRASLKPLGLDPEAAGIAGTRRAEELDVAEFCALARALG